MYFTGTKYSPQILLLLKYKKCSARMEAFFEKVKQEKFCQRGPTLTTVFLSWWEGDRIQIPL